MRNDLQSQRQPVIRHPRDLRRLVFLALLALFLLYAAGSYLYRAFIQSDEEKIRELVASAVAATRERSPSGVTAILSDDFSGPFECDKDEVHRALALVLLSQNLFVQVALHPEPIPVTLDPQDPNLAKAEFQVHARGKANPEDPWRDLNPQAGGTYFHLIFRKKEGEWRLWRLTISQKTAAGIDK